MKFSINLQKKAVLIVGGILVVIIGLNTAVLTAIASNKYRQAILSKTEAVGEGMQREIGKALNLGIPIESIDGLGNKLLDLVSGDKALGYAMIVDASGKVLFHNDSAVVGKELKSPGLSKALSSSRMIVERIDDFYDLSFPLLTPDGKGVGAFRIGVKLAAVKAQLYELLIWALGISIVSFLLSLGLVYFSISRFITRPIMSMEAAADRIASGDLTQAAPVSGKDEIASLGRAINSMEFNLKDMISKIKGVTSSVSAVTSNVVSSSEGIVAIADIQKKAVGETALSLETLDKSITSVAASADSLFESANDTSSAVMEMIQSIENIAESANVFDESSQETASSIEELVANIKQIAESLNSLAASSEAIASSSDEVNATIKEINRHAEESVQLAEKVSVNASDKGLSAVSAAMEGMENIKKSVTALGGVINELGRRSENIGRILNVIEEVTDETNLLALNAAILAAQAGEHGKPFSVVAGHIKGLAEKTAGSTKEITDLITAVQQETRSSVDMAADVIGTVEKGLRLINDVHAALSGIVVSSEASTEKSKAIQRATFEQSDVIKHITEAIKVMSDQVEHISVAIQEQSRGSKFIIDATEKVKNISRQVKTATREQKEGGAQIGRTVENVTRQAEQIAKATGSQKQGSAEIVKAMKTIKDATGNLILSSQEMNAAIGSLKEEAQNLLAELQKFQVK